jgi:hypothetical protein
VPRLGHLDEFFPEFGVGDLGQFHDPLVNAFSLEFGDAVFGHHEGDVTPGGGHTGTLAEDGARYARSLPFWAVEGNAMTENPPLDMALPRRKSTWSPMPL